MKEILVFDVNETLLDLAALDPFFEELLGDVSARFEWFRELLNQAFMSTILNTYHPFGVLAGVALRIAGARRDVQVSDESVKQLGTLMTRLPAHPDVLPAVQSLRDAGFRLATLTNSTAAVGNSQLTNAGLVDLFEMTLSADTVRRLKPAPEPYHMAAAAMNVLPSAMRMVAAHGWDIAGALAAGCLATFVARPGQVMSPLGQQPDLSVPDLVRLADELIA